MLNWKALALTATMTALGGAALADGWMLNGDASRIAFGSVKENIIGEVHSFQKVSGSASADGAVKVEIDLASVDTLIDIRNERMVEHVFKKTPKAVIEAQIDMDSVASLDVGAGAVIEATGTIEVVGNALEIDTEMYVTRISADQVMVTTNDMIMLHTEDLELDGGIDVLQSLAGLSLITRVSPVTLRLVFDAA